MKDNKKYYVDTNVVLRYLLRDNNRLYAEAQQYFNEAKSGSITLVLIPEIVLEIEYVLRKVYSLPKSEVSESLYQITSTPYIVLSDRPLLQKSVMLYQQITVDLADIILFLTAEDNNAEVLSFDKTDFNKIKRKH